MNNKRAVAIIIISLIIIIISSFITANYLNSSSIKLQNEIKDVKALSKQGDWEKAKTKVESFDSEWNKAKKIWPVFLDHFEIDSIEEAYVKVNQYIDQKNLTLLLGEASVLENYIKHIPEKEAFNIKNIL